MEDLLIPNAVYEGCLTNKTMEHNASLTIECNNGYKLVGSTSVQCNNGIWSYLALCVATCPPPKISPTAIIFNAKPDYTLGDTAVVLCPDGYLTVQGRPLSHVIINCIGKHEWDIPNFLECVPADKFIFAAKSYNETNIKVHPGDSISLGCFIETELEHMPTYLWFREQVDIRMIQDVNYTISNNGSLSFHGFRENMEGMYMCLLDDVPGMMAYKVKLANQCQEQLWESELILDEGSSRLLICPDYSLMHSSLPPIWYKDGIRIWNSDKFTLMANGVLFIHEIQLSDDGTYSCITGNENDFCSKTYSTKVSVTSVGGICGRKGRADANSWLVSLWWEEEMAPFCYGARINDRWVITSASCLFGLHRKKSPDFYVNIGNTSGVFTNISTLAAVDSVKIYPFYSRRVNYGDIGLIKLKTPLRFWKKDNMKPLCLPEADIELLMTEQEFCDPPSQLKGLVSGWGTLEAEGQKQKSEVVTIVPTEECQLQMSGANKEDSMFCATGNHSPETQAGDSGSPFQLEWKGKLYLYGIFSWGERASKTGPFDYYTKVSAYTKWIMSYVQKK